jgi:hypothetical protein
VFGGSEEHGGAVRFVSASPDLRHVIVESKVAITGDPEAEGVEELYEWNEEAPPDQRLQLVSVNEEGKIEGRAQLGLGDLDMRGAVSEDGSRVFWSTGKHLYMRDTASGKTLELDQSGGGGRFQMANADGSRVLFTDPQQLTSEPGVDLYECQITEAAGRPGCQLSSLAPAGTEPTADIQGAVVGASENGSWVYFVSDGVLGDAEGHYATKGDCGFNGEEGTGQCNLYVEHEGLVHLITVLSGEDFPDWTGEGSADLAALTARVAPNGEWLAFMSDRSLTGYDNHDAVSGMPDEEVFAYHAQTASTGSLACVSCDPTGARPVGIEYSQIETELTGAEKIWPRHSWIASNVPGYDPYSLRHALYQPRYLSDQGRLFFNSDDALVPQDINHTEDVYEYEPENIGSCNTATSTYHPAIDGCISLISSGTSPDESAFLDASENGSDVFFLTAEKLVHADVDTALDIYDAHVCTSESPCYTEAQAPPACEEAESCRTPPVPQPGIFGPPASATFAGPISPTPTPTAPPKPNTPKVTAKHAEICNKIKSKKKRRACQRRAHKKDARYRGRHR